jgi:hypothetical protein
MHSDTRYQYDIKLANCTGKNVRCLYTQSPIYYYLCSLPTIRNILPPLLHIMSGFRYNQFALFGHDASDSDDSGYVEDDSDASTGDHVDHDIPARTHSEHVDQQDWEVVRRREPTVNSVRRSEHKKGTIVMHVDLHYFPNGDAPQTKGRVIDLSRGGQILEKKDRLFLVVGRLGNSVRECPILTYGNTGLRRRDQATWPEYCSIRPPHVPADDFINHSPRNNVLDIVWTNWSGQMYESMVVHLSDVRSRDTDDGVAVRARISPESRDYASEKITGLARRAAMTARW